MDFVKPDCEFALQRKTRIKPPWPSNGPFSAVHVAKDKSRKMGIFRVFRGKWRREFSAVKTCWRSTQSCANSSPPKFPANREKYREFAKFCSQKCTKLSLSCTFCWGTWRVQRKSEQGPIRELTGTYQGIYSAIRDLLQCRVGLTRILLKPKLLTLLSPTERNVFVQMFELQRERLTPFQDGLNNIRRKESTRKDVPDVVRCESRLPGQRSHVGDLPLQNFFVPCVTARNRLYQCRSEMSDRHGGVRRNHDVNFPAVPLAL